MLFAFFAGMPTWVKTSTVPVFAGLSSNVGDGIVPHRPISSPPGLNDPFVLDQLDIDTPKVRSPGGKAAADFGIDLGRRAGEGRMFLGVHERPVDRGRAC